MEELFIIGKLMEMCYINSTDIEYSQFYNKELTLRIDSLINEKKLDLVFNLNEKNLKEKVKLIFKEIDRKRNKYFSVNL